MNLVNLCVILFTLRASEPSQAGYPFLTINATEEESADDESTAEKSRKIIIVTNWFEELKEQIPVP